MEEKAKHIYTETINGIPFKMIFIEGGEFKYKLDSKEKQIEIPDFYLAETPCTQGVWKQIMEFNPSLDLNDSFPVERVSWDDIVTGTDRYYNIPFFSNLNKLTKFHDYKLPTSIMWQYAAIDGKMRNENYTYSGSNNLKEVGWYSKNSHSESKPVKLKLPNRLGLFDMSGLIREWCSDDARIGKYTLGGSYFDYKGGCEIAKRNSGIPAARGSSVGFRIARY